MVILLLVLALLAVGILLLIIRAIDRKQFSTGLIVFAIVACVTAFWLIMITLIKYVF
jgi:hypothetical protein